METAEKQPTKRPGPGRPKKYGEGRCEVLTASVPAGTGDRIRDRLVDGQSLSDWVTTVVVAALDQAE